MRRTRPLNRWLVGGLPIVAVALALSLANQSPNTGGSPLADSKAAAVIGGECTPTLDLNAQGACTTKQSDTCELYITGCIGTCAFSCSPTSLYVGGNSFIGNTVPAGDCASVIEPVCTINWTFHCGLEGCVFGPECICTGGSNTPCAVSPNTIVPGCAGA